MMSLIPSILRCFMVPIFLFSSMACTPLKQFAHSPRLATNVHRLQIGQTTKSEVFKYFGFPDIEADAATSRVNLGGPLASFWGKHFKASREWTESLPYSSINEQHSIFLYVEIEIRDSFELLYPDAAFYAIGNYRSSILKNKLLIRFTNTGTVESVSYREEFR